MQYDWLPWWLSDAEYTWQCRRCWFYPWVRKIPWRRKWQLTPVLLPGKSHGQRNLPDYSLQGCKTVGLNNSSIVYQNLFIRSPVDGHFSCFQFTATVNKVKVKVKSFSHVPLSMTPWTLWPTRVLSPWDFPGKNTGVGCHFLLQLWIKLLINIHNQVFLWTNIFPFLAMYITGEFPVIWQVCVYLHKKLIHCFTKWL